MSSQCLYTVGNRASLSDWVIYLCSEVATQNGVTIMNCCNYLCELCKSIHIVERKLLSQSKKYLLMMSNFCEDGNIFKNIISIVFAQNVSNEEKNKFLEKSVNFSSESSKDT